MSETEDAGFLSAVPHEDEADGADQYDHIQLVHTGLIRMHIGGKRFRLRRPFFGELRKLRGLWADIADEMTEVSIRVEKVAEEVGEQMRRAQQDDMTVDDRVEILRTARARDRQVGREYTDAWDDQRVEWWSEVFRVLSLDGLPDDWPAWIVDGNLPNEALKHWRSSPLGRG